MKTISTTPRCAWVTQDPIYIDYHDKEWGVPIFDDRLLFEFLILEGAQAGLNWLTILKRREQYRIAFDGFDAEKMARYDTCQYQHILENSNVVRNRLKIQSAISNAKAYLKLKSERRNFSDYLWQFVNGAPIKNRWEKHSDIPTCTKISDALSRDLKQRGFSFVGTTICYAFMQAVGMVNDHLIGCFLHKTE